jgi:hypothetical protein
MIKPLNKKRAKVLSATTAALRSRRIMHEQSLLPDPVAVIAFDLDIVDRLD